MKRPTAIIAEDEPLLRAELTDALATLWPELEILGEAESGVQAVRALTAQEPDVIFLDIQMPGMSGLDVARVASGRCHVVFVTAYDQYAVAAFEQGAVDYVMKPFSEARLATAIARVKERLKSAPANLEGLLKTLAEQGRSRRQFLRWISVAQGRTVRLITVDEICYFQADNKYTQVVTAAGQSLINKTIRELVEELDPEVFFRFTVARWSPSMPSRPSIAICAAGWKCSSSSARNRYRSARRSHTCSGICEARGPAPSLAPCSSPSSQDSHHIVASSSVFD